jgi:tRNA threonylcarbamoyladenosine biosynthesis protein TsaB
MLKNILIIDTSINRSYIILTNANHVLFEKKIDSSSIASINFILAVDLFLKENNISLDNIDCIAVGIGPGSYTGLRVSTCFANAISYAKKIPIICFSSLSSYRPKKELDFIVAYDAKMGGVYYTVATFDNNQISYSETKKQNIEKASTSFEKISFVISPHKEELKKRFTSEKINWQDLDIDTLHLANMIYEMYEKKLFSKIPITPIYQ